ncbi:MAG: L-iditol 2-dehydrogenase [Ancalomicrobiaceae bacterium]|nr:L-iditol 2-dehydrogenase [Ancalomicrobiaceae bacterium]
MTRLAGRHALITGAARGIGRAFAESYARGGATVAIADIDLARAQDTADSIGASAYAVNVDVTDLASIEACVAAAAAHAPIDILINNAAIFEMAPVTDLEADSYGRVFDINVKGTLFMMKAVANHMIAEARRGKIINMSSQAGRRGEALVLVYCASKAAVISATQSAALALARHGITVNAIAPGVVDTEMWDVVDAAFAQWEGRKLGEKKTLVGQDVPLGRMGRPEDIAGMAVFLGSAESDYITAQTFNVDGGNWMS